jgi:hypothetical protein
MTFILPSFGASAIAAVPGGGSSFANDYSISLDGNNDYLDCGNLTSINGATNLSTSVWFKLDNLTSGGERPVLFSGGNGTLYIWPKTDTTFAYINDSFTVSAWNTGQWYHVVTVQSGTAVEVYLDGSSIGTSTNSVDRSTWGNTFSIGRWDAGASTGNYTDGQIDEVALFTSALSSSDVTAIYNGGNGPTDISSLSPKHWWRMGDSDTGVSNGSSTPTIVSNVGNSSAIQNHYALDFDGTDDYALASSLSGHAAPFTMSFWFYSTNDANMVPFHYQDNLWFRMVLRSSSDGRRIRFYGSNDSNKTSTGGWVSGQWNHFAATVDGSGNTDLYINGTYDSTHTGGDISAVTSNFMIGAQWHSGGPVTMFNGQLDEVATWNAVLSNGSASVGATAGGDIAAIYNSGVPNDLALAGSYDTDRTSNLTNWWRMEEGSGTSVANTVGSGTALGLNNGTAFSTDTPTANAILTNGPTYSTNVPT